MSRIKKQRLNSLKAALANDLHSRLILTPEGKKCRALLNTDNLKADYDKQYIAVDYAAHLEEGDVFEVLDNNTHYMIYLPDLVETAYFRSEIIRCRYTLDINDKTYWVYFQGPTETSLSWNKNNGVVFNELNLSGTIYIKNDENTKDFFKRFKTFKIADHTWQSEVIDYISVPGIIEIEIQEFFDDPIADLPVIQKEEPETLEDEIIENTIIGQKIAESGTVCGFSIAKDLYDETATWSIDSNDKVKIKEIHQNGLICSISIESDATGYFDVCYGNERLRVAIDDTKSYIQGDEIVYPYSKHKYTIPLDTGEFYIDSPAARIIEQHSGECTVEITSSRKGQFVLHYLVNETDEQFEKPITIKSL